MKLVQINMFGAADEVVADFTTTEAKEIMTGQPFDFEAWHASLGGEWEQCKAAMEAAKAGAQ